MKGNHIGELEELVLLTVGIRSNEAYGVTVYQELLDQTGRAVNISAIHAVLNRLEEKGLLKSHMGGSTNERGGRRKRFYILSSTGRRAIDEMKQMRDKLHNQLPPLAYNFSV
ncbi:MAG: PadR family transcriptional regulator [Bacteroidota bacterium]